MTLTAAVRHHAPGRLRLRLVDRNVKEEDFNEVLNMLSKSDFLDRVTANRMNHSLVIEASDEEELQAVLNFMNEQNILDVLPPSPQSSALRGASWKGMRSDLDAFLDDVSSGGLDLRKATAFLMLGLGTRQALRGKLLPAGLSLIFYALEILDRPRTDVDGDRK